MKNLERNLQMNVRIPENLLDWAKTQASINNRSLNQFIVEMISHYQKSKVRLMFWDKETTTYIDSENLLINSLGDIVIDSDNGLAQPAPESIEVHYYINDKRIA